jgi:dihydrodipicolinate synthase/N-acetylneuraminate lyase
MNGRAAEIRGMWAAMPLPWNADGSLDTGALGELVSRYRAAGLAGCYCTGTDGEFHTLESDEFQGVVEAFAAAADQAGIPIQAGTGWLTLRGAIERTQAARDVGVRIVQVVSPFWVPVNDTERLRYYEAVSEAVPDVSIVLYNTERIGRILSAEQIRSLAARVPAIVGSKYDGLDRTEFAEICAATPQLAHFPVDLGIGPSAGYPTPGMYSWMANLNPVWTQEWWTAIDRGDWDEADRRYRLAMAMWSDWEPLFAPLTASPALAKLCARVGILPEMPLAVRPPYEAGTERDVAVLRRLIETKYPELAYRP